MRAVMIALAVKASKRSLDWQGGNIEIHGKGYRSILDFIWQAITFQRSNAVVGDCYIRLHYDSSVSNTPGKLLNHSL